MFVKLKNFNESIEKKDATINVESQQSFLDLMVSQ